jgi:hypothetical protein
MLMPKPIENAEGYASRLVHVAVWNELESVWVSVKFHEVLESMLMPKSSENAEGYASRLVHAAAWNELESVWVSVKFHEVLESMLMPKSSENAEGYASRLVHAAHGMNSNRCGFAAGCEAGLRPAVG